MLGTAGCVGWHLHTSGSSAGKGEIQVMAKAPKTSRPKKKQDKTYSRNMSGDQMRAMGSKLLMQGLKYKQGKKWP